MYVPALQGAQGPLSEVPVAEKVPQPQALEEGLLEGIAVGSDIGFFVNVGTGVGDRVGKNSQ